MGITLLESMLLMNHTQIERVTRGLIPLAKVIPHLRSSSKGHELRGNWGRILVVRTAAS
jgi:hypothetical protein